MRSNTRVLFACLAAQVVVLVVAFLAQPTERRAVAAPLAGHTFVVTSTVDAPDADTGDGICASALYGCTLRAAIMQANFATDPDTITVPAGTFMLTRPGNEDGAVLGDLDILHDVAIVGAGPGVTIIDGNGAVTGDRVFQILDTAANVGMSGFTVRNGRQLTLTFASGGGIYWTGGGGHLLLSNLSVEGNQAHYGGGIYLDYSASGGDVSMDNVIVRGNTATNAAGGGLVVALNGNIMNFALRGSQVYSNTAFQGGGIYLQSTIQPFAVYSASIESSTIYSNTAAHGAGIDNDSGNAAHPLQLIDAYLHHNRSDFLAGAIENNGAMSIVRSNIDANSATMWGGGIYNREGWIELAQSTVSRNAAEYGAGIYSDRFTQNNTQTYLLNSTISSNSATHAGGGLYASGGNVWANNATIAANTIITPVAYPNPTLGAGIFLTPAFGIPAAFTIANTLIGNNTRLIGVGVPAGDDCYGLMRAQGYNLIQTFTNCGFANPSIGDITGQDPVLGPLQNNGGSTLTHALLTGSPSVDAGRPTGCTDAAGAAIPADQRGFQRAINGRCDIGAFEYSPYDLHLPLIRR